MVTEFEINMLYREAFGFRGLPFPYIPMPGGVKQADDFTPGTQGGISKAGSFSTGETGKHSGTRQYTDGLPYTRSLAGAPLYMPTGFDVDSSIVQLPNEPIVSCSIQKTIVETVLAGNTRKGTVKEIINTDDWRIKIMGLCIDPTKQGYPEDEVESIQQLFELNRSVKIVNYVLNTIFEIKNVVIKSLNWKEMQGKPFSQAYEMELVSDEDFLLTIT